MMALRKKLHGPLVAAALLVPFFGFQFASAGSPETALHPSKIDEKSLQDNAYPAEGVVLGNHEGCERSPDQDHVDQGCPVAAAVSGYVAGKVADYAWEKAKTDDYLDRAVDAVHDAFDGGPHDLAEGARGAVAKPLANGAVSDEHFDNF